MLTLVLLQESKPDAYINIIGYKVVADENVDPGRYDFYITHDTLQSYYFSSDEQVIVRGWMKALIKANITRNENGKCVCSNSEYPN
jgi:hypothetical protein